MREMGCGGRAGQVENGKKKIRCWPVRACTRACARFSRRERVQSRLSLRGCSTATVRERFHLTNS